MLLARAPRVIQMSGRGKDADFRSILQTDATTIQQMAITEERKALMDRSGRLGGIYTFTWPALFQICGMFGNGLYTYIESVCGQAGGKKRDEELVEFAAKTYNEAVRFNFENIRDTRFVITRGANTVDGHIGRSFVMVYNSRVYDAATEIASGMAGGMDFVDGVITGRDMSATFCSRQAFASIGNASVRRGLLVQNRETGGRAIRLSNTIFDTVSKSYSMDVFHRDTRIAHIAPSKVITKMMELSDAIAFRQQKDDVVKAAFAKLVSTSVSKTWNRDIAERFAKATHANMLRHDVPVYAVDRILAALNLDRLDAPKRMDVYTAVVRSAGSFSDGVAVRMRQYAYLYLFEKN